MSRIHEMPAAAAVANSAPSGGLIIASDGTTDADGAVRVGLALAHRDRVKVELVSVVEPIPVVAADGVALPDIDYLMGIACESRSDDLVAQRDRTHPGVKDWPFSVDVGPRAETIVARADRAGASLIVLGLGTHGVGARIRQRETALRVIRTATRPVLAVPRYGWGVPRTALAAIDFTPSSVHAAKVALDLLDDDGSLYLAHVTSRVPIPQGDSREWSEITTGSVLPKLEALARHLAPRPGINVEFALLHGEPAHELLAFARQSQVDMIATGTHGRSAIARLMLGSVSTKLIRAAHCWVLVAPPQPETKPPPVATDVPND